MNNLVSTVTTQPTMTSREIAELTGKELKHVNRDIRTMLDDIKKDGPDLDHLNSGDDPNLDHPREEKDERGYTTCFHLNQELTLTLLTGYSTALRYKVVKRWHELETVVEHKEMLAATKQARLAVTDQVRTRITDTVFSEMQRLAIMHAQKGMLKAAGKRFLKDVTTGWADERKYLVGDVSQAAIEMAALEFYFLNAAKFWKLDQEQAMALFRSVGPDLDAVQAGQ